MSDSDLLDLTAQERKAMEALARELPPPPEVEDRIVEELRARGLLARPGKRWTQGIAAAAAVAIFAVGWAIGVARSGGRAPAATGARYALLVYGEAPAAPPDRAHRIAEYRNWAVALRRRGLPISGEKLGDRAWVLEDRSEEGTGKAPTDGLGGFFIIAADGDSQALAIARSHPHVRYGGRIVVRPIEPTSGNR